MIHTDQSNAVGLTQVHVNRLIQQLTKDKLMERTRSTVTLVDEPGLLSTAHLVDQFRTIDSSWFPPVNG